jgi:hypothetical protein
MLRFPDTRSAGPNRWMGNRLRRSSLVVTLVMAVVGVFGVVTMSPADATGEPVQTSKSHRALAQGI